MECTVDGSLIPCAELWYHELGFGARRRYLLHVSSAGSKMRPAVLARPRAGSLAIGVGPSQNLRNRHFASSHGMEAPGCSDTRCCDLPRYVWTPLHGALRRVLPGGQSDQRFAPLVIRSRTNLGESPATRL